MIRFVRAALAVIACAASGGFLVFFCLPAYATSEDPPLRCYTMEACWKGSGWYMAYDDEGPAIFAGPFGTLDECTSLLPTGDKWSSFEFDCILLETQPKWDQ